MASAGHIFYSQVDSKLQRELNARGSAGKNRTNADLDYMLGKVANVQINAYTNTESKEATKPVMIHSLGGSAVQTGNYVSSGFLRPNRMITSNATPTSNNTYKIPPFISSCEISTNDHTMGTLNSATVNILIPNPDQDLDFMESIYARPGRAIELIIEHPDSAIITTKSLTNAVIQPALPDGDKTVAYMNSTKFDGLIISFDIAYNPDGTVNLTIHLRGTSNVYTDVTMLTNPEKTKDGDEKQIDEFYKIVYGYIITKMKPLYKNGTDIQLAHKHNIDDNPNTLKSADAQDVHYFQSNQFWDKTERVYIQLGQLIRFINNYILSKQLSISNKASIICNDEHCYSNYYEKLISADPENILIVSQDIYGVDLEKKDRHFIKRDVAWKSEDNVDLFNVKFNSDDNKYSYPSRMFINMDVVKSILDELKQNSKTYKVKDFLVKLNEYIVKATGGAINMELITHPENPGYLLFYDTNYLGDKYGVQQYSVPMFANHPHGSIVREFRLTAKLPTNMQALMYTTNNNDNISEEQIAPYLNYMYNNSVITRTTGSNGDIIESKAPMANESAVKKLEAEYKASHEKYLKSYTSASQEFGDVKKNESKQKELQGALQKYIQYPTPEFKKSAVMQSPIYPYEVEFTIDGINGFRYGDALSFDALPKKYKNGTTFSVISVVHTVNENGEWTTKIKCIMRPHFTN